MNLRDDVAKAIFEAGDALPDDTPVREGTGVLADASLKVVADWLRSDEARHVLMSAANKSGFNMQPFGAALADAIERESNDQPG